jgi:phosphoribosyl-dephospho-CoA transferase
MIFHRHDLALISEAGRRWACNAWREMNALREGDLSGLDLISGEYSGVKLPGIVRREEIITAPGSVPLGFSSPYLVEGHRLRMAAFVPAAEIISLTSPYYIMQSVVKPRTNCLAALQQIRKIAQDMGLMLGVWGSAGLEMHTKLPYTHESSDLDLLLKPAKPARMFEFASKSFDMGQSYGLRVDIELDLPNGYGASLIEMMHGARQVLGKGLEDVILMSRPSILAMCA